MAADLVPETKKLDTEDAWEVLRRVRYVPLLKKSMLRFRRADGYSYARAVAFAVVLTAFPALIFLVAFAVWLGSGELQSSVDAILTTLTPGSTSAFFQQAVEQGQSGARSNGLAMLAGGMAALTSGAVGMSQIQQGAGRLYGKDEDRSFLHRYALSLALSLSVGLLLSAAFVAIAFGGAITDALQGQSPWAWLRWPLGAVAVAVALAVLYQVAPNRDQPGVSWLIVGGITATVLWLLFSGGLAGYLTLSSTFGDTYGRLAGLIGFFLWAQLSGLAVLAGLAFAAQLEAERAVQVGVTEDLQREARNSRSAR
ncbi:MAG TPA: YihY/virulence factor BrkB family protein [Acidimicrobiia bacterium]|nr:YihY/virulence factor BrkB family protein [Acidimicrobiia bacterium]